jgi:hypothetical protein
LAALLILAVALWGFANLPMVQAQQLPAHVFTGKTSVDSNPPPDGTIVTAWIDGRSVARTRLNGGKYTLRVRQPEGQSFAGRIVTYRIGGVQTGERRPWKQGGSTNVNLNVYVNQGRSDGENRLPGRFIRQCVDNASGRLPLNKADMTADELNKANLLCPSLKGRGGALRNLLPQAARGENAQPEGQRRQSPELIRQQREFQADQRKLDADRLRLEQVRITRAQELQNQQDRLNSDRLKSARERQIEQSRLDAARLKQDQDRINAEKEFEAEQRRLDQRRAIGEQKRQDELEQARFESEKARIGRESALEKDRARLDQERLKREQNLLRQEVELNKERQRVERTRAQGDGQPPVIYGVNETPDGQPAKRIPSRGFFTNSQVGQLGSVNRAIDPGTLAVIGILITLAATTLQLFKGN